MNYNSLMNKPTINYRELIGDNTVTEVGGITEEQFNTLLNTDLSSYYTKTQIDDLFSRSYVYREKSGSIVTFDCPASVNGIDKVLSEIVAVQSGTGDPSPTNVRPISGWSAVNVVDTGVNVWDEEWESGLIDHTTGNKTTGNGICSKNYISVKADTNYYAHIPIWYRIAFFDANKIFISGVQLSTNIFTTPTNAKYMKLSTNALYGTTYNNDISINYPSTDTGYHAYNGHTYTTTLKDGQGNPMTCYGGTLDVVNGVLTVDRVSEVFDGSEDWSPNGNKGVFIRTSNIPNIETSKTFITDVYKTVPNGEAPPDGCINYNSARNAIQIHDERAMTTEAYKTLLQTNPIQLVYELATPLTIQLTPTAVKSLLGTNNIWADTGDITVKALDKIIQG